MKYVYIENVNSLTNDLILCDEVFEELFLLEKESERLRIYYDLQDRAKVLGVKTKFDKLYRAKEREFKKYLRNEIEESQNVTNFSILGDEQLICGDWIADDSGVWIHTDKGRADASYHPIFPTKILRNAETGTYKVELTFVVRGNVRKALVDREDISSPAKIVKLANASAQVTSLNAPYLVKFLADIESLNPDIITEVASTSRLGWISDMDDDGQTVSKFLPYDKEVVFDNELNTRSLFDSITQVGKRDTWYDTIANIRSKKQIEVLINIASSFASVLVEPCGALPFIVSLWGGTGIGKTVVLMIATSIWANPSEGQYMTDAKATATAMEIRLNILNSLPMTLDDMAQIKNQQDEDFSQLIYRWCAGKGRDRSNVNLGLNKLTSWRNCTITNGERSLVDETTQGGAVNRVIDIENDGTVLFSGEDGNRVANILRSNFGFAGRDFVQVVEELGFSHVTEIMNKYFKKIQEVTKEQGCEKEDKQIMPMALILAADEISEQYLFKDGVRLDVEKCCRFLKNKGEVSEHKRAYEFIKGFVVSNSYKFKTNEDETSNVVDKEMFGFWKSPDRVCIIGTVFDNAMKRAGFQSRAFLSWAKKQNLIETQDGRTKKVVKINGSPIRCVVIDIIDLDSGTEFEEIDDEIPF